MRKVICSVVTLLLLFVFSFGSSAVEENLESQIEESFFGELDEEVGDILKENGIDSFDYEKIFSSGFDNIRAFFSETLEEKLKADIGWFFLMICLLMLMSIFYSVYDFSSSNDMFSLFTVLIISVTTVGKITSFVNCTVSAMDLNGKLMLSFVPVFTLLISLSGNPASALTYNSIVLFFCELMSAFMNKIYLSLIGAYFSLSIAFSLNSNINLNRFVNCVNRCVNMVLGFCASMFTGFLTLRNILSYSTDSLTVKGVKFLISSLIPVIGSSLSDAYSAVLGSINLMKGTLGVIGISALVLINIPALCEGVMHYGLMSLLSCFAEILGLFRASEVLRCFSSCVRILLLVCLFQVFILLISTGIMLSLKGS